ncbi:alpha/beta fold hydrolase [Undibacterium sp.]|uniref:S9 family peptidase n=1 Tax=Undibacterium sp. TaxID=1914977 RepID=UPI002731F9E9|nr:alpha/beta fold hydrolase [Undibacterium sp.]MDP1980667.1 prolyl oligopeptidase family serine peptidase [Undibacterium sp.]
MNQMIISVFRCFSVGAIIAGSLALPAYADSVSERIPVEKFFKSPQINGIRFSPDGKYLAMISAGANERLNLAVMNLTSRTPKILAQYEKSDVTFFSWVNNNRLVFGIGDRKLGAGEVYKGSGLFAVNKDGSEFRQLIETMGSSGKFRVLTSRHYFVSSTGVENSDDVIVAHGSGTRQNPTASILKLNTLTGYNEIIQTPPNSTGVLTDMSGEPRIAMTNLDEISGVQYKDPNTKQWRKLIEYNGRTEDGFSPAFIAPDGQLYVTANQGQDTKSVYRYDLEKNQIDATPLISAKGFDFSGSFIFNKKQNKLLGVRYETDAPGVTWFDEKYKAIQKKIDEKLPNTVNMLTIAEGDESNVVLVTSFSDIHPGSTFLFDTKAEQFTAIGDSLPEVDSKKMSYQDFFRIKARDGMEIPVYLTLPRNSTGKNLPMVVMVHGGPYVRGGRWGWNPQTQFLASRGYAVLEPDFRGSTGYGKNLFKSGWKQWGLAMQDDITDATKWAIEKGYADANRVCIAGASYGGYAVLMGLIKDPDLYRCGISWVGVSDINLLYDVTWSDQDGSAWQRFGMPILIGDQQKDAEQLKATSPAEQAHRLTKPLILAYGVADRRVPLIHGEKFKKAAPANAKIEWITYKEEGHGWRLLRNNVDFWTKVEKFLDENTAVK